MRKVLILLTISLLLISLASAATLKGTIYDSNLDVAKDSLIEINTNPTQKFLAKEGDYLFEVPQGEYIIKVTKGFFSTSEQLTVSNEGEFVYDLFLLEDFSEEDELWQDTNLQFFNEIEEKEKNSGYAWWRYLIAIVLILYLAYRLLKTRKKYGRLKDFRKNFVKEKKKTVEEHKEEIASEPGYLDRTLEIIKKHDGRISQKHLRKEMLDLSEAKISLILTELEHKDKIEKVKKGRGNVIILK
jgi:uncharacterized membrane protein